LRRVVWVCIAILSFVAPSADAAGIQLFNHGPALSGAIWYPCPQTEPQHVPLGDLAVTVDYGLVGVKDCPLTEERLPLVVFSHGHTGWFGGHHDTAEALADAGFVVAAINHPGDNGKDSSRSDDLSVFGSRPADMVRLLDFLLHDWKDKDIVDSGRIGFFGFSKGGYTGLVLVGAAPDFARVARACNETTTFCGQLRSGETPSPPHDARIRAAVIADPPSGFFTKDNWPPSRFRCSSGDRNWEARVSIQQVRLASPAAFPERPTFMSCRLAISLSWRRARRNSRPPYRAFAPTCRRASTEQRSTANSIGA
jgi:predicted dienelactone hydrolase